MNKCCIILILLSVYDVYCNVTSTCTQKDICNSYLDIAMDMISKAKWKCNNCQRKATDCYDVLQFGYNKSGIYEIWPNSRVTEGKSVRVYCDMETNGGGWTVIQRRGDFGNPKDYFYRDWQNYKEGFGEVEKDFWLGNDNIFALTNQKLYSVRFDLKDIEQNVRYALYDKFWIDDEDHNYTLHINSYSGDAGDSMAFHNNQAFSTKDRDNDSYYGQCAADKSKGGWWYAACHHANLNGLYHKGKHDRDDGVSWYRWKGHYESLESTEIKIRPRSFRMPHHKY